MAWKNLQQTTLVDAMLIEHEALKELDDVHELINWSRIESLLAELHSSRRGEKAWPPLMMFKALLLQSWYALSDPALEKQLARDLLFRRFIGLSISESVPDHSTLWRFRQLLEKQHIMTTLLNGINDQLAEQGLYIKAGEVSIIDASVIEAKQCRPHKREDGSSTQDLDAAWNVKVASDGKRKSTYGYKVHINVDEEGLIKALAYTAGNVHDSNHFTTLLKGNESAAYADSAYQSEMHTDWLTTRGIENRLIKRAYRNRPLSQEDKVFNQTHTGVRSTVERVFGVLKQHYAMGKARYLGLGRNRTRVELMCVAHNIKRGLSIRQGQYA